MGFWIYLFCLFPCHFHCPLTWAIPARHSNCGHCPKILNTTRHTPQKTPCQFPHITLPSQPVCSQAICSWVLSASNQSAEGPSLPQTNISTSSTTPNIQALTVSDQHHRHPASYALVIRYVYLCSLSRSVCFLVIINPSNMQSMCKGQFYLDLRQRST